jgi:hypothetical protein
MGNPQPLLLSQRRFIMYIMNFTISPVLLCRHTFEYTVYVNEDERGWGLPIHDKNVFDLVIGGGGIVNYPYI